MIAGSSTGSVHPPTNSIRARLLYRASGSDPRAAASARSVHTLVIGTAAIVFSVIYLGSDILEVLQGGFSTERLVLTYLGEATIALFVIGLYSVQVPMIGRWGLFGALAYGYSYIFFTTTVMFALVDGSANYSTITDDFGIWMTVHGAIMVVGGIAFGATTFRAGVLPAWTGPCLMVGVVLVGVASSSSDLVRTLAQAVPAAAFIGMGIALLRLDGPSAPVTR